MKLIDNINYKLTIEDYKKELEILKSYIKKQKYYIILKILGVIAGILLILISFNNINLNSLEIASEDIGWTFLAIFGFVLVFAFTIFLMFGIDEIKDDKKRYEKGIIRLNTNESIEDKALNISKEHLFYAPHSIYELKEKVNFIDKNYKVLKMQYNLKENNLYSRYVENNEIKDKKFYCEIHYFEELKEPELVLTNEKILLNIKYKEEMDFEIINLIP
jgi:hypothetical protein